MTLLSIEKQFSHSLKSIARNLKFKAYIQQSSELNRIFKGAAKRFVTGDYREDGVSVGNQLIQKGYRISLEFIGENTINKEECLQAKDEFIALIKECGDRRLNARISFDLSHIGLSIEPELAYQNLMEMAKEAQSHGLSLMISMEESAKTDPILAIYKKVSADYSNVGITLQAQLHRTVEDLNELLHYPGAIRIVKGAYQEPSDICTPRSEKLDQRYLELVEICVKAGHQISIASHDNAIYEQVIERGFLRHPYVEAEMLYGIRPEYCKKLKEDGLPVRVYLTYGVEWYLYLCHRIAEYPPNIYSAITDMICREREYSQLY
ncbi:proline dehydrogenase family protein [Brevibacillus formosus]|uniref:proline dehydrogenase n=1 Tax=Brevibacillus formosus TaxID=54913 RepID=A0A837KTK9_9BACL|nr:proline dehydrogenase family protein [Brevibacillus formosus]KLI00256.1 proline dehydrogenase [Brevibacillus formosus]PSJ99130.1 proline dehydrogenase [Brevibacillus formosus]GED60719.1 proline dehydrogenase [Brevibacillus formosus]